MNKPQSFIDKNRADTLLEKWAPVLDYSSDSVKTISNDTTRLNTAILLENQEKWCLEEANTSGGALVAPADLPAVMLATVTIMPQVTNAFLKFLSR